MIRERSTARRSTTAVRRSRQRFATDALMLFVAASLETLSASAAGIGTSPGWRAVFVALILGMLALRGVYRPTIQEPFLDGARMILSTTAVAAMLVIFVRLLFADHPDLAEEGIRSWLFASVYMVAGRGALASATARSNRLREGAAPTLILGAGEVGHLVARRLLSHPELGLRPVGFLDRNPADVGRKASGLPLLGTDQDLERVVREHGVEHAVIGFSRAGHEAQLQVSRALHRLNISVSVVPRLFEGFPDRITLDRVAGLPLITIHPSNPRAWTVTVKYASDRVLSAVAIVLMSPLLLFAAIGTALTLGSPIFFRQRRVGLDGREFEMLKFRTLPGRPEEHGEADAEWAASVVGEGRSTEPRKPETESDPRRPTRLGELMRRYGLDELPQLFNVLRGQMSMVGPRPERSAYVAMFRDRVRRYDDRHQVKAGITGWAQVNGLRGDTSLSDRIEWDNYYVENWSPWLDLKILLLTAAAVFRGPPQ